MVWCVAVTEAVVKAPTKLKFPAVVDEVQGKLMTGLWERLDESVPPSGRNELEIERGEVLPGWRGKELHQCVLCDVAIHPGAELVEPVSKMSFDANDRGRHVLTPQSEGREPSGTVSGQYPCTDFSRRRWSQ